MVSTPVEERPVRNAIEDLRRDIYFLKSRITQCKSERDPEKKKRLQVRLEKQLNNCQRLSRQISDDITVLEDEEFKKSMKKELSKVMKTLLECADKIEALIQPQSDAVTSDSDFELEYRSTSLSSTPSRSSQKQGSVLRDIPAAGVTEEVHEFTVTRLSSVSPVSADVPPAKYVRGSKQVSKLDEALDLYDDGISRLEGIQKLNVETLEIGRLAGERLKQQTEKMKEMKTELNDLGADLKRSNRLLNDIVRRTLGDRCILLLLILSLIIIITLIILRFALPQYFAFEKQIGELIKKPTPPPVQQD